MLTNEAIQFLYREDIRDRVPMPSSDAWIRWAMHSQLPKAVALYKKHISDEWTDLIEQIYELCRNRWYYLIPVEKEN